MTLKKETVTTSRAPSAIGPYSQAVKANGFVFVSGQIPLDPVTGDMVPGDVQSQTKQILQNLEAILEASGSSLGGVVKTTVYMKSLGDFAAMNEVYATFFTDDQPARATVEVAGLPKNAAVEIDAIAVAQP